MTKTVFELTQPPLNLYRYPRIRHDPLQAWNAADEYLYLHLCKDTITAEDSILIFNDMFGALALPVLLRSGASTCVVTDSWLSQRGIIQNMQLNALETEQLVVLDCLAPLPATPQWVLIRIPKTLALLEFQLIRLREVLVPGTKIIAAGMVRDIHTSTLKLFERYIGSTRTSLARKKARLVFSEYDPALPARKNPYPTYWPLEGTPFTISNHANVFSRSSLDLGARVMMRHLPQTLGQQRVADLGCGNGVLSLSLLAQNPHIHLSLIDESLMALSSARNNIEENLPVRLKQCRFIADNCMESQPEQSFDLVVCNPPFHQQQAVTRHIAEQMIQDAWRCLKPGGRLLLIGNRHLGYHVHLRRVFNRVEQVGADSKFIVLEAKK